jgi:DamX protein
VGVVGAASWYFVSTAKDPSDLQIDALREKVKEQEQQAQSDEAAGSDSEQGQSNLDTLLVQKWDTKAQKAQVDKAIKAAAATAAAQLESSEQQNNSEQQELAEETVPDAIDQGADPVQEQTQNPSEATQTHQQQTTKGDEPQAQSEVAVTEPQDDQAESTESVQTSAVDVSEPARSDAPADAVPQANVEKATLLDKMDNSWFLAQNDATVVLQLTGVSNVNTLQSYLNYHKLGDKAHVYQSIRNDKPWFVVTYGLFDSLQQANAAKAELPKTLRGEPWAKFIRTIKTEILNADKKIQ